MTDGRPPSPLLPLLDALGTGGLALGLLSAPLVPPPSLSTTGPLGHGIALPDTLPFLPAGMFLFGAACLAARDALAKRTRLPSSALTWSLLLLAALVGIAALRAADPQTMIPRLVLWGGGLAAFAAAAWGIRPGHGRILRLAILAAAAIVCIRGVYERYGGIELVRERMAEHLDDATRETADGGGARIDPEVAHLARTRAATPRIFSTLYPFQPNALGGYLAMLLPFLLGWILAVRRRSPIPTLVVLGALLLTMGTCLAWTGSRGGWVAAILGGSLLFLPVRVPRGAAILFGAALLLIGIGTVAIHGRELPSGVAGPARSLEFRTGYWATGLRMAHHHLFGGVGLGQFAARYEGTRPEWARFSRHAHNDPLELAAEAGIPALALFAAVWIGIFVAIGRRPPDPTAPSATDPPSERWWGALLLLSTLAMGWAFTTGPFRLVRPFVEGELLVAIAALLFAILVLFYGRRAAEAPPTVGKPDWIRRGLAAGLLAFLIHGLIDMDAIVPGVWLTAWALGGIALGSADPAPIRALGPRTAAILPLPPFAASAALALFLFEASLLPVPPDPDLHPATDLPPARLETAETLLETAPWLTDLHGTAAEAAWAIGRATGDPAAYERALAHAVTGRTRRPNGSLWHLLETRIRLERTLGTDPALPDRERARRWEETLAAARRWTTATPGRPEAHAWTAVVAELFRGIPAGEAEALAAQMGPAIGGYEPDSGALLAAAEARGSSLSTLERHLETLARDDYAEGLRLDRLPEQQDRLDPALRERAASHPER